MEDTIIIGIMGIVGSLASIFGIFIIWQNNNTAVRLNRSERFKNAVEQLGSAKNPVLLGAVYSLHRIAQEDTGYREQVFNLLCGFVRDSTAQPEYQKAHAERPSEPIQSVLNLICLQPKDRLIYQKAPQNWVKKTLAFIKSHLPCNKNKSPAVKDSPWLRINLERAFLRGAVLNNADLNRAIFNHTDLSGAMLRKAILSGAILDKANLSGANLFCANLSRAFFYYANLSGASLSNANLSEAQFFCTNLSGADFSSANLNRAQLLSANLSRANLWSANLSGALLSNANLSGASLNDANLSWANLDKANLSGAMLRKAILSGAVLNKANLSGVQSQGLLGDDYEARIRSRIGKETDLSGIKGGFDPQKPPYTGTPIMGVLSQERAEEIIKEYRKALGMDKKEKSTGKKPKTPPPAVR